MSIPYSSVGSIVNTTFTSDGTRSQLVNQLVAALTTAGWSTISGSGTTDIVMQTATTPQGFFLRTRFYDPGTGNCAQFFIKRSTDGTLSGANYLLPTTSRVYRIIAGPYWFYFYSTATTDTQTPRYFIAAHCPWVPDSVQSYLTGYTDLGFIQAQGNTDTYTTTGRWTFRSTVGVADNVAGGATIHQGIINGVFSGDTSGYPQLVVGAGGAWNGPFLGFVDGTMLDQEAYIGWSATSTGTASGTMKLFGMLWDAFTIQNSVTADTPITFDSKSWLALTHSSSNRATGGGIVTAITSLYVRTA